MQGDAWPLGRGDIMRRFTATLVFILLAGASILAVPATAIEQEARQLEAMLVAPCCWSQQVSVHQSEAASQIKSEIRLALNAGQTRQQILDAYVAQYGTRILIQPPARGFNATLYVLPVVALVFSAGSVAWLVRRFTRERAAAAGNPGDRSAAPRGSDPSLESRLDDELEQLD